MNNRIIAYCIALVISSVINVGKAQDMSLIERLYGNLASSCIEIEYTYGAQLSGVRTVGDGVLLLQGDMWRMDGNGVLMWCDAETLWIADPSLKEAVIESASGAVSGELSNPAMLFMNLETHFYVTQVQETSDGKSLLYILTPKTESDIEYCNVEILRSDASISKGEFIMADGNVVIVTVSDMTVMPKKNIEAFRPSGFFDSSWIITDMR